MSAQEWFDKGEVHRNKNEFEKAIVCYDKALEIHPKYKYAWHNKGFLHLKN